MELIANANVRLQIAMQFMNGDAILSYSFIFRASSSSGQPIPIFSRNATPQINRLADW